MNVAGLILMGGKAVRMNRKQKAFLLYQDRYFYQHIIKSLTSLDPIYLSVANKEAYPDLGYPMIEDVYKEIGPLGGIYSALKLCKEEALLVVPCDVPKISQKLIDYLLKQFQQTRQPIVVRDNKRIHPLIGIYPKSILSALQNNIQNQQYRASVFVKEMAFDMINIEELLLSKDVVSNINSPKDLKELQ